MSLTYLSGKLMEQINMEDTLSHMRDENVIQESEHSFTMGGLWLTNLLAFCDGFCGQRKAPDAIYLDFCKAFEMVTHHIFKSKLERYRFEEWTIWWISIWLEDHSQSVVANDSISRWKPVMSGDPKESVLGAFGVGPEESHRYEQRSGASLLQENLRWFVQSGEENAQCTSHCSLSILKGRL